MEVAKVVSPPLTEALVLTDPEHDLARVRIAFEVEFVALPCDRVKVRHLVAGDSREFDLTGETKLVSIPPPRTEPTKPGGCIASGVVDSPRGAGDLHVTLLPHAIEGQPEVTGITLEDFAHYNASHEIRKLRFFLPTDNDGDGGASPGKLDDTRNVHHDRTAHYVYHLHVVPVVARGKAVSPSAAPTRKLKTFVYNHRETHVLSDVQEIIVALQRLGLPGLYLSFDFSSLVLEQTRAQPDWVDFLIHLIGIVGGVSVLAAVTDTALHLNVESLKRKLD